MAKVIHNPSGRSLIRLSVDDIFLVIEQYQQLCNSKTLDKKEARKVLLKKHFYLPEEA